MTKKLEMCKKSLFGQIKPDFKHEDERGKLIQLVSGGYSQINYIETQKGSVRGWHYHKQNTEAFFVINGSFKVDLWSVSCDSFEVFLDTHEEKTFKTGEMFFIRPYTLHVFSYFEETSLISFYSNGVETETGLMDIFKPDKLPVI